jgi:hypothetical protein
MTYFRRDWLYLILALLCAASMWCFFDYVLIASQVVESKQTGSPRGNLSDLYPRWLGARELLLRGRDPYSQPITDEIQQGYYGRKIDPKNPNDPKDENRFAYPVYVVFLLAPTVNWSFGIVQRGFCALLFVTTGLSIWWWMRALHARWRPLQIIAAVILLLGSYPAVQGFHLQQISLLVAALIAAACAAAASGWFAVAGVLMSLAMIKPQLTIPIAAWLLFWAVSKWRERKWLVIVFALIMAAFLVGSELMLPGWFAKWREASRAYMQYAGDTKPLLFTLFGRVIGSGVTAALIAAIVRLGIKYRKSDADTFPFKTLVVMVTTATVALTPIWHPYDQVLLIPAIAYCALHPPGLSASPPVRIFSKAAVAVLAGAWALSIVICAVHLLLPGGVPKALQQSIGFPIVLLPLACLISVGVVAYKQLESSSRQPQGQGT